MDKLQEHVSIGNAHDASHAREFLDLVCIADTCVGLKSTWVTRTGTAIWQQVGGDPADAPHPLMCFAGNFFADHTTPPVGSLLAYLLIRLGWEDPQVRPFADYFRLANILSNQSGGAMNMLLTGLTAETVAALLSMPLNEVPTERPRSWDGWGFSLA
ncbi:hypothetical protein ACGFJ4_11415 [Micromonospora chalcea]|uniref:hypothetical protein n=1 Tax=Micromonospora chalcea TaxID=1874 RepID=UPI003711D57E